MQFELEFDVSHLTYVLKAARNEIEEPEELLNNIGESLLRVNRRRHEQGADPNGKDWKELSPMTLAAGERKGGPLKKTGRMLQSLIYQVDNDELRLWFDGARDAKLAAIHQGGTEPYLITPRQRQALAFAGRYAKRVNHPGLPKRELIGFPDADRDLVENVATDHLQRVLQQARSK